MLGLMPSRRMSPRAQGLAVLGHVQMISEGTEDSPLRQQRCHHGLREKRAVASVAAMGSMHVRGIIDSG